MAYNMPRVTKSFIIGDLSKMRKGQSNNQIKTCLQSPVSLTLHCTGGWMEEHMLDVNQILVQQQNILNYPVETSSARNVFIKKIVNKLHKLKV